ncbi:hypothetical protein [Saccharopolyspora sp. 6M]|uniref:hypothetical protein n=1 Tax=Saccharopolyspora sp. 6M TaxID=2877237 RepID=UPI001CD76FFC|nr:hypothetical protein [Saccharopolyspora sp. 6M]MCA1225418.1 hypothetical protein [Saccharopolyspora sp. 6M]
MKGYAVHLLFHALAVLCGAALGIAGTLWWVGGAPPVLWAALAALVLGVVVLVVQGRQLAAEPRPARRPAPEPRPRQGTRPELAATAVRDPDDRWRG